MGTKTNRQLLGTHKSLEFRFTHKIMHRRTRPDGGRENFTYQANYRVVTLPFTPSIGWFCIEGVAK